jgi:hypothetical protein
VPVPMPVPVPDRMLEPGARSVVQAS